MALVGQKVELRRLECATLTEVMQLREWRNRDDIRLNMKSRGLISELAQEAWFHKSLEKSAKGLEVHFLIFVEDELIGYCNLMDIGDRVGNFGIYIGNQRYLGKGCGKDALRVLLDYGFNQLGLHRIWSEVLATNQGALNLYLKLGFVIEGTLRQHYYDVDLGKWLDVYLVGLLAREFDLE